MATSSIDLGVTTWVLVATESGFVGQNPSTSSVEFHNDTSLPTGDVASHVVPEGDNLQFPTPATGNWYARAVDEASPVVVTEV